MVETLALEDAPLRLPAGARLPRLVAAVLAPLAVIAPTAPPDAHVQAALPAPSIVAIEPGRFWDTRAGQTTVDGEFRGTGRLEGGETLAVRIGGRGGVPVEALAVFANLIVSDPASAGSARLFPCGRGGPTAALLGYVAGDIVANGGIVALGASGDLCVRSAVAADVALDITGYTLADSPLVATDPLRVLDAGAQLPATGFGAAPRPARLAGGQPVEIAVAGVGGIPADATAAFVNVTAVDADGGGSVSVYPCDDQPTSSTIDTRAGAAVSNGALVDLADDGSMCVVASTAVDVLVDVTGYVTGEAAGVSASVTQRFADTRPGQPTFDGRNAGEPGRLEAGETVEIQIAGRGAVPTGAAAAFVNLRLVGPGGAGVATLFPCGVRPSTPTVTVTSAGAGRSNNAFARLSAGGTVCVFTSVATDMVLDVSGSADPADGTEAVPPEPTETGAPSATTDPADQAPEVPITTGDTTTSGPPTTAAPATSSLATSEPDPGPVPVTTVAPEPSEPDPEPAPPTTTAPANTQPSDAGECDRSFEGRVGIVGDWTITGKVLTPTGDPSVGHVTLRERVVGSIEAEASANDAGFFFLFGGGISWQRNCGPRFVIEVERTLDDGTVLGGEMDVTHLFAGGIPDPADVDITGTPIVLAVVSQPATTVPAPTTTVLPSTEPPTTTEPDPGSGDHGPDDDIADEVSD